jgi:hypothetical protein
VVGVVPLGGATATPKLKSLIAFASVLEIGTGLALLVEPRMVIALLLGGDESALAMALGRVAGILMLALGLVCWPQAGSAASATPPLRQC